MARLAPSSLASSLSLIAFWIASSSALPVQAQNNTDCFPPANSTASSIQWGPCPPELDAPESLQCATFSVPIDWDQPYGDHFDLGLAKLPATPSNTTSKIGSLFINPGGPGGSAAGLVAKLAGGALPAEALLASFDIIGLDPRGVGLSHQVQCDQTIYAERVSLFPQTQEEYDALVDKNKRLGESCRNLTGPLLEHIDTISVVKDHEAVRVALGNEPLNFLGLSYGSQLGSQYAELFPDHIRTMVLDGITQHSLPEATNILIETSTYGHALTHFFEWAGKNKSSPLQGQDVASLFNSLVANATKSPIPASSCNGKDCATDVNGEELLFNAQGFLVFASGDVSLGESWGVLASALYNATQGDASALSRSFIDPTAYADIAIGCLDWTHDESLTLADVQEKQIMAQAFSPLTGGVSQTWQIQHACIGWPIPVKNPPKKLNVQTEATILTVNSVSDPETSYVWALGMLEEIENTVLVTRNGDGHTSVLLGGDTATVEGEYLITGKAPEKALFLDS